METPEKFSITLNNPDRIVTKVWTSSGQMEIYICALASYYP